MLPLALRRVGALLLGLGLLGSLAVTPVQAAGITVNSVADTTADDGACTLREAIIAANTDTASGAAVGECAAGSGSDTITFSVAGTITLTSDVPIIYTDMTIDGVGAIAVSGASLYRVFNNSIGTVFLSGLGITAGLNPADGGAIVNGGTMIVSDSTISGNTTTGTGGAIFNSGTLTVTNSTLSGNSASGGGGIFSTGTLTVTSSTISGNTASGGAGGGIITTGGTATVANSTISGNSSLLFGGGINSGTTLLLTNSTISGNFSSQGGGGIFGLGVETIVNSIIAGNSSASLGQETADVIETVTTSIIGVPGGKTLADILVPAGLADNGGSTQTIALAQVPGNPAIDAGTSATCAAPPVNALDQRGRPRPGACDIGAYEAQPPTIAAAPNVSVAATSGAGAAVTYNVPDGTDDLGGALSVVCLPVSGSTFAGGSTTVTCTASDVVGHIGIGTFLVNVSAFAPSPGDSISDSATAASRDRGGSLWAMAYGLTLLILLSSVTLWWTVAARRRGRAGPR